MEKSYTIDIGLEDAVVEVRDLSRELLVLRLAFGKLKTAVADAAAPVASVLVSALSKASFWAIRLVKDIGRVISALMGIRVAETTVEKAVTKTASAVQRSLAGFDQLNRLEGQSGGTDTVTEAVPVSFSDSLTPQLQGIVDSIRAILAPLLSIDLAPLQWSLARAGEAFEVLGQQACDVLQWLWFQVLTPFAAWITEKFLPVFLYSLKSAIELITAVLAPAGEGFGALWQAMRPVAEFVGQTVLMVFDQLRRSFVHLTDTMEQKSQTIREIFQNLGQAVGGLWQSVSPALTEIRARFAQTFEAVSKIVSTVAGYILDAMHGVTEFLAGAFTGDWSRAWQGITEAVKSGVNGVIGFLNAMLTAMAGALNGVIQGVNKLSFTAPDWVPGLGGKTFGFNLKTVSTPQIPYLARGAVLPANQPFLAMVGDQKHGTNIEAPLATIQEAVALVMNEQLSALMAGFDATVQEIRQLHSTVSNIQVGDTVIGTAAQRYAQKMAVMRGGQF